VCNSPSRFFVHEDVHDAFVEAVARFAKGIVVGPGTDPATTMGALANRRRVEYVAQVVDEAVSTGATVVCGGGEPGGAGYYFEPTVLTDVRDEARVFADEVFGPVVPVARYSALDEVVARANATAYGLAAFVFTGSLEKAHRMARSLDVGMVGVNTTVISRAETPFGGVNASGHGWESGVEGVDVYLRRKAVLEHAPVRPGSGISH
jgi:succinate-semialdehyde dehydrogenase/glutarate-semialdehyde dehydrogenase